MGSCRVFKFFGEEITFTSFESAGNVTMVLSPEDIDKLGEEKILLILRWFISHKEELSTIMLWRDSSYTYQRWLGEFLSSRSGRRLSDMFGDYLPLVHYTNTTSLLGRGPSSCLPYVLSHLRRALLRVRPAIIVACGKQAESACQLLPASADLFCIPHPAYRLLTTDLLRQTGEAVQWRLLLLDYPGLQIPKRDLSYLYHEQVRVAFRQLPGHVQVQELPIVGDK